MRSWSSSISASGMPDNGTEKLYVYVVEKSRSRRAEIRKNRPDAEWIDWQKLKDRGVPASLGIAAAFFFLPRAILMLRQNVVPYRPGQWLHHDVVSRVGLPIPTRSVWMTSAVSAATASPPITPKSKNVWAEVEPELLQLPDRFIAAAGGLPSRSQGRFSMAASATACAICHHRQPRRLHPPCHGLHPGAAQLPHNVWPRMADHHSLGKGSQEDMNMRPRTSALPTKETSIPTRTYSLGSRELRNILSAAAQKQFSLALQPKIVDFTLVRFSRPIMLDDAATADRAQPRARRSPGNRRRGHVRRPTRCWSPSRVHDRPLDQPGWQVLRAEHQEYIHSLKDSKWKARLGVAGIAWASPASSAFTSANISRGSLRNHPGPSRSRHCCWRCCC